MSSDSPFAYRIKSLSCYLRRTPTCPGPPLTAIIATTHRCNMSCRMCIRAQKAFDGPDMEMDLFKKIIDEGAVHLRYLSFDGPGETILNPEAFAMFGYAKSKGIRVMFSTNALALDKAMASAILDAGVDMIIFSVDGANGEVYRAVHGTPAYAKAIANIHQFLEHKRKRTASILVIMQMIRLPETQGQVSAFYQQWRGVRGIDMVRVKQDVVGSDISSRIIAAPTSRRRRPCPRLWYGPIFIETNGEVYASPGVMYKAEPIGNVAKASLSQIWNGPAMQAMRRAHARGEAAVFPECRDCRYPQPRLPLVVAGFFLDPFAAGKLVPLVERLAFWHRLPLFERYG